MSFIPSSFHSAVAAMPLAIVAADVLLFVGSLPQKVRLAIFCAILYSELYLVLLYCTKSSITLQWISMAESKRRYTKKKQALTAKMVRLPAEVDAEIVALAAKEGVSMNAMIIQLLRAALAARAPAG